MNIFGYILGASLYAAVLILFCPVEGSRKQQLYARRVAVQWMDLLLGTRIHVRKLAGAHGQHAQDSDSGDCDTVVLCSNHVNLLDTFVLFRLCHILFPSHHVRFVYGKSASHVPLIGSFLQRHHVSVNAFTDEQEEALTSFPSKTVLVFFPEGNLRDGSTLTKSITFSEKIGEPPYRHVLHPRTRGWKLLTNKLETATYLDVTLIYPWRECNPFVVTWDFLVSGMWRQLSEVHLTIRPFDPATTTLQTLWREKDRQLCEHYTRCRFLST